jgi:hypothetical protein
MPRGRGGPSGPGTDPNFARFAAKVPAVIQWQSILVLPLMYHLVHQGMQHIIPRIATDVSTRNRDLRLDPFRR